MCGITGIIGLDSSQSSSLIQLMTDSLQHRGPDAGAIYVDKIVAFGQRRLSIIDLSDSANQPFFDITKRYVIVFNGEIYNYQSVREKIDYNWQTTSDTEVILAAYIKWGSDCLQYLNGMFALAIWDKVEETLFIARDRLGVKPLYYYQRDNVFIFSSELRSIVKTNLVEKKVDPDALVQYLSNMAVKTPKTIVQGIIQLKPGEYAYLKQGVLETKAYWRIAPTYSINESPSLTYHETVANTRTLFKEAVKSRMVADVPVGAFLSGGIDSSAIVAEMAGLSDKPIRTFSIIFEDKRFDESEFSRLIAQKYKTQHTELLLAPNDLIAELPNYIRCMDSPTVDGINSYIVSKLVAKTGIKVAVSGLGGDELFAGYTNFSRWKQMNQYRLFFNNQLVKGLFLLAGPHIKSRAMAKIGDWYTRKETGFKRFYGNSRSMFLKEEITRLLAKPSVACGCEIDWTDLNSEAVSQYPLYSQYSIAEMTHYTLDVLLKDTDQMSMAWGLEIREPFFDYRLIEFMLSVPDRFKFSKKTPKRLLVDALGDLLPKEIVYRKKKGFSFPWDTWLRGELKSYCEQSLARLGDISLFNKTELEALWDKFMTRDNRVTWMHIWSLVVLEHWLTQNDISAS